ncbi:heavy-metal-associated domain-containing protein [Arthrospiribacter ruber]|uniref:Copper chaperone n=1 Tax=Arthrospiribacter ruber TaxID=2487934 RepID=A0A951IWA1_9BACT|nr:heavy-metal-associated domain-containing protein [Arthrospiribacter ruber]MBW3467074.1 copper chaperone [Arthrospiribacter ruber]
MKKIQFKTTIMCNGCLEKVTPQLNNTQGIENWSVDLQNPDKILTVEGRNTNEEDVITAVKKVGFQIERV